MGHILILGIGSPQEDDRAGWAVAERLRRELPDNVSVELSDRPGAALLAHFRRADHIILIDAMRAGMAPGTVRIVTPAELHSAYSLSSHGVGVAEAIALADALGELPRRLTVVGIEAGDLSSAVIDEAAHTVRGLLHST